MGGGEEGEGGAAGAGEGEGCLETARKNSHHQF